MGMVRVCESRVRPPRGGVAGFIGLFVAATCAPGTAAGQVDPNSGIDFVTIGATYGGAGNPAWRGDGTSGDATIGRGSVNYEYRIGRYEVTTAQWVEFFNAAFDRPANDRLPHLVVPQFWGATPTAPTHPQGERWTVLPGNEQRLTADISWRMAAMYCNWLCNNKSTDRSAFLSGAYDVSTFGYTGPRGDIFTDQAARSPGARYFIPTWDEWLKAAHFDPNKVNADGSTGGWWVYSNGSNVRPRSGRPPSMGGTGEANWGFNGFDVPLGAYAVTSPWGLYDTAGGTAEWTETIQFSSGGEMRRYAEGSWWSDGFVGSLNADSVYGVSTEFPSFPTFEWGLRIAAVVPAPSAASIVAALLLANRRRRGDSSRGSA